MKHPSSIPFYYRINTKLTAVVLIFLIIFSLANAAIFIRISWNAFDKVVQGEFETMLKTIENVVHLQAESIKVWARHFSEEEKDISGYIYNKDWKKLYNFFQRKYKNSFPYAVTLIDRSGKVVHRFNGTTDVQDDSLKHLEIVKDALSGRFENVAIVNEFNRFMLYISTPIIHEQHIVGAVLIGVLINNNFTERIKGGTNIDLTIIRDRAVMATTLKDRSKENIGDLPIPYLEYQMLLTTPEKVLESRFLGQRYFVVAKPLNLMDKHTPGSIFLSMSRERIDNIVAEIINNFLAMVVLSVLIAGVSGIFMTRRMGTSIKLLTENADNIALGKSHEPIHIDGNDEISVLARSFNIMQETIESKNAALREHSDNLENQVEERTKELLKNEEKFRTVADFTYDWEYWVAPNGRYLYVSPSCKRITGYIPEDFINNPELIMEIMHPDDRTRFTRHQHMIKESDKIFPIDFRIIAKNGDERWIGHICQAVYDTDGRFLGLRGSNRDITEYIRLQKEILKARKLESLGELAGGIAHDFNNLLFMVMGNISLARDDLKFEAGTSENLKAAEKACIKAKELSVRLITFSKGGGPVKKISSINDLLKNAVTSALQGFNIKPKFFITDAVRQVNIDESQIRQVFNNIVINAKEAMDDNGQLKVSCENIDILEGNYLTLNQGKYIKISFEDQGCGISKENLEQIFDPYFSTKKRGADKGQGLGLAVSYSIIEKHGGLITVKSELEIGSTFSVYLLAAISDNEPDSQKLEGKFAEQKTSKHHDIGTGKILLMDDEEAIRIFLGQAINRLGYDVKTCTEGKEAIETYKKAIESKEPFDVVILDLTNKLGMGGQETMKRLLEIDHNAKGIVITGYFHDPVVTNFKAYGFSGFLGKPATKNELNKVIGEVISKDQ